MKKVKNYKGFVIAVNNDGEYLVFTKEEWAYGPGVRYVEHECGSDIQEAIDFIDSY